MGGGGWIIVFQKGYKLFNGGRVVGAQKLSNCFATGNSFSRNFVDGLKVDIYIMSFVCFYRRASFDCTSDN